MYAQSDHALNTIKIVAYILVLVIQCRIRDSQSLTGKEHSNVISKGISDGLKLNMVPRGRTPMMSVLAEAFPVTRPQIPNYPRGDSRRATGSSSAAASANSRRKDHSGGQKWFRI